MTVPLCPRCGERDKVIAYADGGLGAATGRKAGDVDYWCDRCVGFLSNLSPLPGKHTPDDIGSPLPKRRRRQRKSSTPALVKKQQHRGGINIGLEIDTYADMDD